MPASPSVTVDSLAFCTKPGERHRKPTSWLILRAVEPVFRDRTRRPLPHSRQAIMTCLCGSECARSHPDRVDRFNPGGYSDEASHIRGRVFLGR